MKMFTAIWGDGYTIPADGHPARALVENVLEDHFTTDRGYTTEHIEDVMALLLGECLSINDSGIHSVVRTR